ncbi:hypothetical protein GCM10023339_17610 [Alloalcanivorax gelatiniphagus]
MRRRASRLQSVGAALVVVLLAAGCSDDTEPDEPTTQSPSSDSPTGSPTEDPTEEPAEGPVAGTGAGIDPGDVKAWCGAVTPEQLSAATGFEVAGVASADAGVQSCTADLPGTELLLTWGSEPTKKSFEQYAAGYDRPAGVYAPTTTTLAGGQPVVVAPRPDSPTAFAGTVVDGRLVQVAVSGVVAVDADPDDLGEVASQVLAVYFD